MPLTLGQRAIGLLTIAGAEPGLFGERELRLLQTLSVSLAASIESGRLVP
jgi:GAF domain-containing protein